MSWSAIGTRRSVNVPTGMKETDVSMAPRKSNSSNSLLQKWAVDSFEYLCYGSTTIRNICPFTVRGSTKVVRM